MAKHKEETSAEYTDEMKAKDEALEAKKAHYESLGLSREAGAQSGAAPPKVELHGDAGELFKGWLYLSGYSGDNNAKLELTTDLGTTERGRSWLEYAFRQHFGETAVLVDVTPTNAKEIADKAAEAQAEADAKAAAEAPVAQS